MLVWVAEEKIVVLPLAVVIAPFVLERVTMPDFTEEWLALVRVVVTPVPPPKSDGPSPNVVFALVL